MTVLRRIGLLLLVVLAVGLPASPGLALGPGDIAKQMATAMSDAIAKGDVDAIAALYAKDAVVMLPSGKTASGRDAIRQAYADNQAAGTNVLEFGGGRALGGRDQLSVIWTWELTITPEGQGAGGDQGALALLHAAS